MELGLTWPLQRLMKSSVPYGEEQDLRNCWDAHCITLHGRSSLLLVHSASRYTLVRFDMTPLDWKELQKIALEEIRLGLAEAGPDEAVIMMAAGDVVFTRTHGRRPVAYLNRAWEDVLKWDILVDRTGSRQPLLNHRINEIPCRCAATEGQGSGLDFLRRCLLETEER